MNLFARLSGIVISVVDFIIDVKEIFREYIRPNYRESRFYRIRSQDGFDKAEVENAIIDEIQEESNVDFSVTHYISEDQLEPMELHDRYFKRDSTNFDHHRYSTKATVKLITDSDWGSADDAVQRCRDRLEQYGTVSVAELDADIKRSPDHFS